MKFMKKMKLEFSIQAVLLAAVIALLITGNVGFAVKLQNYADVLEEEKAKTEELTAKAEKYLIDNKALQLYIDSVKIAILTKDDTRNGNKETAKAKASAWRKLPPDELRRLFTERYPMPEQEDSE